MPHKRFVSSGLRDDPRFARLCESGPLAPLVYVLGTVHADDWGRLPADGERLKLMMFPFIPVKCSEIEEAVRAIADAGLWELHEKDGLKWVQLPEREWYRLQSYIGKQRRENCRSEFPNPDGTWPGEANDNDDEADTNDSHFLRTSKNVLDDLRASKEIVHSHSLTHALSHTGSNNKHDELLTDDDAVLSVLELAKKLGLRLQRRTAVRLLREYGLEFVVDAIAVTSEAKEPSMRYLFAVLNRWRDAGGIPMEYEAERNLAQAKARGIWPPEPFRRWLQEPIEAPESGDNESQVSRYQETAQRPQESLQEPPADAKESPPELSVEWFKQLGFVNDEPMLLMEDVRYLRARFSDEAVKAAAVELAARGACSSVALRSAMEAAYRAG